MINRLLIIPARGNSKRIPHKNIKLFNNKPIIGYVLHIAKKSKLFSKIHVSTESEKVFKVVKKLGFEIDFMRPKKLSRDKTPTIDVLKYVHNVYISKGESYDEIWTISPCSPLLIINDLKNASAISKVNKNKITLAITRSPFPIHWSLKKDKRSYLKPLFKKKLFKRSQDLKKTFFDAGAFAIFPKKLLTKDIKNMENMFVGFDLPSERSVDIDDIESWKFAEYLHKASLAVKKLNE